jgi:hypothetical protein
VPLTHLPEASLPSVQKPWLTPGPKTLIQTPPLLRTQIPCSQSADLPPLLDTSP